MRCLQCQWIDAFCQTHLDHFEDITRNRTVTAVPIQCYSIHALRLLKPLKPSWTAHLGTNPCGWETFHGDSIPIAMFTADHHLKSASKTTEDHPDPKEISYLPPDTELIISWSEPPFRIISHVYKSNNLQQYYNNIKHINFPPKIQTARFSKSSSCSHPPSHLPSLAGHPHSGAGATWKTPAMCPPSIDAQRSSRMEGPTAATEMNIWADVPTCEIFRNMMKYWEMLLKQYQTWKNEIVSTGISMSVDVSTSFLVSGKPAGGKLFCRQNNGGKCFPNKNSSCPIQRTVLNLICWRYLQGTTCLQNSSHILRCSVLKRMDT